MQKLKKPKKQAVAVTEDNARQECEAPLATHAHLIRIADQEARRKAIVSLGKAQVPYCGLTGFRFLVTDEHLEVLKREAIPFEILS